MRGAVTTKGTLLLDPEAARARKREAFLETLRSSRLSTVRTAAAPVEVHPRPLAEPVAHRSTDLVAAPRLATGFFRAEAVEHRLSLDEGRGVVRMSPPWTWAVLGTLVVGLGVAVASAFVGEVEVTGRGRGIIRPTLGVRALTSQLTGTVVSVEARSGDVVKAGAALLRIDAPGVAGQLLEAERQLEAVRTGYAGASVQQDRHYEEQVSHLRARARRLAEQVESLRGSVSYYERRLKADLELLRKGLVSEMAAGEWRESLAQAQRQLSGAEGTLDQTRQELASVEGRRQEELWQRQQLVGSAESKRDSLALVSKQAVVRAPEDGTVEALVVRAGEAVQAGQVVGKVVPLGSPIEVVSFLPERDRAFAKAGDPVELELDQLPAAEYGTLKARVVRIANDLASPSEVREAFGEDQKLDAPSYRVELAITDAGAAEAAHVKLRTGTLLNVRYTLRRQKLITLAFSPLRRWIH